MKRLAALAAAALLLTTGSARPSGQSAGDLFNPAVLHQVEIWVNSKDWEKLKENFQENEYYPADLTWNGETMRNTGIRSRGKASRNGSKPGLRVDFNRYASDQRFLGLKSLVLDNLSQDPSGVHETTAMWLFAQLGLRAPREAHVRLYVNGEYAGLYALIEPVDKVLLARTFGIDGEDTLNDGYLYEFNKAAVWDFSYLGSDLEPYWAYFESKTNKTKSAEDRYRLIETIVRLANEKPSEEITEALGGYLDLPGLVRYVAAQNFVAENDGFVGEFGVNNFFLYREEHGQRHVFIAWDEDLAFLDPAFNLTRGLEANVLMSKLMQVPEYRALYFATLKEAADLADARPDGLQIGALEAEIRRQLELTEAAMREDTRRSFTETEYVTAADLMKRFATVRIRFVQCEVARLTGSPAC